MSAFAAIKRRERTNSVCSKVKSVRSNKSLGKICREHFEKTQLNANKKVKNLNKHGHELNSVLIPKRLMNLMSNCADLDFKKIQEQNNIVVHENEDGSFMISKIAN